MRRRTQEGQGDTLANVMRLAVLLAILTGGPSCGGKSASPPGNDAGGSSEGGVSTDGPSEGGPILSQGACDLFLQDCPDGTRCDFFCDGASASIGCRPGATGGAVGATCSAAKPCTKGTGCLANAATGVLCRPYCQSDADCSVGHCHVVNVAVGCAPDAGSTTLVIKFCF
jgi:hypothetical protein